MNNKQSIGFGARGWCLLIYQFLAYCGYCAFTNFPQNMASSTTNFATGQPYIAQTTITFMNLIGSLLGYVITYFVIAPRIGRMKSMKKVGLIIGVIALVCCAGLTLIPLEMAWLWYIFFVLVLITTQLWACFFATLLIGNWFPRRKGTVMGIVTMAFPLVTGIGLSLCYSQFFGIVGPQMGMVAAGVLESVNYTQAFIACFGPYWILSVIALLILAIFLKDFPEQCGAYRDNDKNFTPEMAQQMMIEEIEARKKSVWKRSKIWGCKDYWFLSLPSGLLLSGAMAFMVQIIPVLNGYGEQLDVLKFSETFPLLNSGPSTVLFGLAIFACFGSWLLGVLDTKWGTKTAVFITSIIMLAAGILGFLNNVWCSVAATWLLGLFMGAASNFGLSGVVRYWRQEDFPSVMSGAPPVGTIIGAAMPFVVAAIAAKWTYTGAFLFIAILAVICIVLNRLFNPRGIIKYDNKLREEAGLPIDDVLEQRLQREGK